MNGPVAVSCPESICIDVFVSEKGVLVALGVLDPPQIYAGVEREGEGREGGKGRRQG